MEAGQDVGVGTAPSDDKLLRSILNRVSKKVDTRGSISVMGDKIFLAEPTKFIPTSCTLLNYAIGGGFAVGKISEIAGDVQTGKSALLLDALANNQKAGGLSFYLDAEFANSSDFARKLCKIDDAALGHVEVKTQEAAWSTIDEIVEATSELSDEKVIGIGFDSLAALPCRATKDRAYGEPKSVTLEQKVIYDALRKLAGELAEKNVALIFTNHEYTNIGGYGEKFIAWGGRGPKYFASTRIHLHITERNYKKDELQYLQIEAIIKKNRFDPPGRKIPYIFNLRGPNLGIDNQASIVDFLNYRGCFGAKKGWLEFDGTKYRRTDLIEKARQNADLNFALEARVKELFSLSADIEPGIGMEDTFEGDIEEE